MNQSSLIPIVSLGASQATELPKPSADCLADSWAKIDTADLSTAVLQAAALEQALYTTGTELLETDITESDINPAPTEQRSYLPEITISAALRMMNGDQVECLQEWFNLATKTNACAPATMLPMLLDYGTKNKHLREAISQLVSTRGAWLSQQYDEWNWLEIDDPNNSHSSENHEKNWQTGTDHQRLHALKTFLQNKSTQPENSELILASWKDETPEFKTKLIATVSQHLSSDQLSHHEPWLQLATNDPRKEVRAAATSILLSLTSNYRTRAIERAKPFISLKRTTITITPPDAYDDTWTSDGIKRKIPAGSTKISGEKAGWLRQILSRVPLPDWAEMLETTKPLHKLKLDPDWAELLRVSQHEAALHTTDKASLLEYIKHQNKKNEHNIVFTSVMKTLNTSQTYEFIQETLKHTTPHLILSTLQSLRHPPETPYPDITKFILKELLAHQSSIYTNEARALALCIHAEEIPATLRIIAKAKELSSASEEFANLLELRISYITPFRNL